MWSTPQTLLVDPHVLVLWYPWRNSLSTAKQLEFMWEESTYQASEVEHKHLLFLKTLLNRERGGVVSGPRSDSMPNATPILPTMAFVLNYLIHESLSSFMSTT